MKKTAILLMLITIVSKILGFARELALSYFYGASNISDAYIISMTVPAVIFGFIGVGISTGYIPMYSKIEKNFGEEEGIRYTNNLVNILLVICTIAVIIGILFTSQLVKIFASGFKGETLELAIKFTEISVFGMYFTGLLYIFSGFLRLKGNYVIPALVGLPMNFFIILSIFVSYKTNPLILAIGSVIAIASQVLLLIPFMYKEGYNYVFIFDFKDEYIRNMLYIASPIIIGASVDQINVLIDRTLASNIAVGGISALNYANKLNLFVQGLFVSTISTVMYPIISKMSADNNINGLKKTVLEAVNLINILVVPSTIGAIIFSEQVVKLLFGRGAFNLQAISMTTNALLFYSIGMIGYGLREILSKAFYSLQDTKTPMINASIAVGINIILNIILSRFMGVGGLALATSISAIFCTVLLFVSFRNKIGPFGIKNIIISFLKILFASLIMGVISKLSYDLLFKYISSNLSLIISIIIGAFVYFSIINFMGIQEVDSMIDMIKIKLKSRLI